MRSLTFGLLALTCLPICACSNMPSRQQDLPPLHIPASQSEAFAQLALEGVIREFPNKPSEVQASAEDARTPKSMHPAFYGNFDWHSAVHSHWMLVRLLKNDLGLSTQTKETILRILQDHFTEDKLRAELDYFSQPHNRSFERMYGWAWYFTLCREVASPPTTPNDDWASEQAEKWSHHLAGLEELLADRVRDYLPKLTWPNRVGVHQDTAFALGMIYDWAVFREDHEMLELIEERSRTWYQNDKDWPAAYEPSGEDFFSAGLNEANLMRRILSPKEFHIWLQDFLPQLASGSVPNLLQPVSVSDLTDGKIVHLAGLNLSRAWCFRGIASSLSLDSPMRAVCEKAAQVHLDAGLDYVFSGNYAGEHWLASFAVYLMTDAGI